MRELTGWEILLGGALAVFLLWRWRPRPGKDSAPRDVSEPSDWPGLLGPVLLVALFVLALIAVSRS